MAFTQQQLETMISESEIAYHALMLGQAPRVVVDQNGERVEFTVANSSKLKAYIAELRSELSLLITPSTPKINGPARFVF